MPDALLTSSILVAFAALAVVAANHWWSRSSALSSPPSPGASGCPPCVGIGTVRSSAEPVTVEVESVAGQRFVGRLHRADDAVTAVLQPGVVLLVSFDPAARERLLLADDVVAVRSASDRALIRHGTRSQGVVTGMRPTGAARDDHREVEIDMMVRRPEGGQFPVRETALVQSSALGRVTPGSVVDAYYRRGDETTVAVRVPRASRISVRRPRRS